MIKFSKEYYILHYGKSDGDNEIRWQYAIDMSQEIDESVGFCFTSLIALEDKRLISFEPKARGRYNVTR